MNPSASCSSTETSAENPPSCSSHDRATMTWPLPGYNPQLAMVHLWDAARLWLWIHPWYHATILFGTPVVVATILGLWGLHHSHEANRLSGENNRLNGEANLLRKDAIRLGEEQKTS